MKERIIISIARLNAILEDAFNAGYDVGTLIALSNAKGGESIRPEIPEDSVINMLCSENGLIMFEQDDYNKVKRHCYDKGLIHALETALVC